MRVGRILRAEKHPNADTLYVEQIDLGEDKPRTVVSGLVRHVPLEQVSSLILTVTCIFHQSPSLNVSVVKT